MGRALIAAVGQPWMRDLAFGSHVVRRLHEQTLPTDVDAHDLSFSPIAAVQMIEDGRYDRAVFVTANAEGRAPGRIYERAVEVPPVSREELHARIGDSVMGCVSLETLLIICDVRGILPPGSTIVDVEPEDEGWGPELSDSVAPLVGEAARLALARVTGSTAGERE